VADVVSKTGASSLIGQTEGTVYAEVDWIVKPEAGSPVISIVALNNNVANLNNCIVLGIERSPAGTNRVFCLVQSSGSTVAALFGSNISSGRYKLALTYKTNDFALYVNGVQISTAVSGNVPTTSQVLLGSRFNADDFIINDHIKAAAILPRAITEAEAIQLTS
jgi:hypothetical protein